MEPWNKSKTYILPHLRKGQYKTCKCGCGEIFYTYPSEANKVFASRKCANVFNSQKLSEKRRGKDNPMFGKKPWNYKGGNTQSRYNHRYWIWRREIFIRDNYTCQNCTKKLKRKDCTAHHIKPWSKFPKLRYEVSNGITYCRPCHNVIDPLIKAKQFS